MTVRATSQLIVGALMRSVQSAGGNAAVIARGDPVSGAILVWTLERGRFTGFLERALRLDGYRFMACGPQVHDNEEEISAYAARRRSRDPDLWIIELDIADVERFTADLALLS